MEELNFDTGLKEIKINGGRIIRFNPADIGFLETLYGMIAKVSNIQEEKEKKRAKSDDIGKLFDYERVSEKRMREAVDSVFGENFCDDVFSDIRLLAMADGLTVIENFVYAVIEKMDESVRDNLSKRNERIQKYAAKYHK